jgi:hypothetical protein
VTVWLLVLLAAGLVTWLVFEVVVAARWWRWKHRGGPYPRERTGFPPR